MLRAAGAPTIESDIVSDTRLMTGTLWHAWFEDIFDRLPVMTEVKLDRWLPAGWSGTADWIIWSDEYKAFVLGDLKTIKGEGMPYIERDGIKKEHLWQLSAYWYALREMGIPLLDRFVVFYLPMNASVGHGPTLLEGKPLNESVVSGTMLERHELTERYLADVAQARLRASSQSPSPTDPEFFFLHDSLAPVSERVQALRWNKPQGVFDVKLVPHWAAQFCPFPDTLCDCSTQGTEKVGQYALVDEEPVYQARKGYEEIAPEVTLGPAERKKLLASAG